MARIDLVALQERLAQQQPTPVPAEPPSWTTRPAPASALRTTPPPKAPPAAASAAAPAGTLRATTTMRAALPLKATRTERAEERARTNALRAQIDELNAELVVARAEADRVVAEERQRVDRLKEQVEALSAEVVRAEKLAEAVVGRAERAEAGRDAERVRAEVLRTSIEELKAGEALMIDMHARELAVARHDALAAQQAAAELRQANAERRARGRWARLKAAWRGR
jgi:DNA repair exonuclease SbcCD ATPase subunit